MCGKTAQCVCGSLGLQRLVRLSMCIWILLVYMCMYICICHMYLDPTRSSTLLRYCAPVYLFISELRIQVFEYCCTGTAVYCRRIVHRTRRLWLHGCLGKHGEARSHTQPGRLRVRCGPHNDRSRKVPPGRQRQRRQIGLTGACACTLPLWPGN